jgi:hypothetical protein
LDELDVLICNAAAYVDWGESVFAAASGVDRCEQRDMGRPDS